MQTSRMLPSIMMNTMCHNLCLDTEVVCAHTVTLMLSCYMCVPLSRSRWAPKSGLIGTLWIRRHWFSQVGCLSCIGGSSLRSVVFLSCSLAILACAACLSEMPGGGPREESCKLSEPAHIALDCTRCFIHHKTTTHLCVLFVCSENEHLASAAAAALFPHAGEGRNLSAAWSVSPEDVPAMYTTHCAEGKSENLYRP